MDQSTHYRLQMEHARLVGADQRLAALNPLAVLQRGFALVTLPEGQVVHSTRQVQPGQSIGVQVSDGRFNAQVSGEGTS
jgi:exodeoxyribonuclease VII large subunit